MIAVVDYGVGNLFSLCSSLRYIGAESCVTSDPAVLCQADKIILPGVGAFADAAEKLRQSGLTDLLCREAEHFCILRPPRRRLRPCGLPGPTNTDQAVIPCLFPSSATTSRK